MDDILPNGKRAFAMFWRGLYGIEYEGIHWVIGVDYLDISETITVFRNGVEVMKEKSPFRYQIAPGVSIEAEMALYGMKRAHLVNERSGTTTMLNPLEGTAEAIRLNFETKHPVASKAIAAVAWVVLLVALVTQVPNLVNSAANFADAVSFPIALPRVPAFDLPDWVNCLLSVMGIAAGLDRGLRMKHNPLLDD